MSQLTVVARVSVKKEHLEDVKSELLKMLSPTRKEDGCIEYNLHQDNEDPTVFIFYETWENSASLEKHIISEHYKSYVNAVGKMLDSKVVNLMTRL